MKFEAAKNLKEESFRRLTGVKRATFVKMVEIIEQSYLETNRRLYGL